MPAMLQATSPRASCVPHRAAARRGALAAARAPPARDRPSSACKAHASPTPKGALSSRRGALALGAAGLLLRVPLARADEYDDEQLALLAEARGLPPIGVAAPVFDLSTNSGNGKVSLESFRGGWVCLYFYPKDFTGGCSIEAAKFQSDLGKFQAAGASVLGVSVDTVDSHRAFCEKKKLTFPLLSDSDAAVSKAYGSVEDYGSYGLLSARNTFLIAPDGTIAYEWVDVRPAAHSTEVLAKLEELKARAA